MPNLTVPQAAFLALPQKYRAFVGGYGSGKTWVGCASLCRHAYEWPRVPAGYFAPTYPQIRDIFYPTVDEVAYDWGLRAEVRLANKEVDFFAGRVYRGTAICRSMDKPGTIVGFKIGHALVDEIDTLPMAKATEAWRKIIARMRVKRTQLRNGIDVTTTPEGFGFAYEQFEKAPIDKPELAAMYGKIHASTYDNEANLPDDYIPSLFASYPAQHVKAYLRGLFVNLRSGAVYPEFDRRENGTLAEIRHGDDLHVGMDFNVGNMNAIVCVVRDGWPLALDELTGLLDTPAMIKALRERFPDRRIIVYPDASGGSRNTNDASRSDLALLRNAGFRVLAPSRNPSIRDRVVSVNAMLCNAKGERRLLVNAEKCPKLVEDLEKQVYDDNGMPEKGDGENGHDHRPDALGYFIHAKYPALRTTREKRREPTDTGIKPFTREWLEYGSREPKPKRF